MLEIRNIYKTYRSKNAPETKALVDVSVKFENTGMVFVLGKSGSGKSTFLNVVGGLDKYDSGEIIIKGKSSEDFTASDFDSYRNTYLGFIFQEYNIIDEFSIGRNIALALELQHKKSTAEDVEKILSQVDMAGYGDRMPNQISGGQKQRVAIARALIKEPEIIMADEPTGALDSNTGEQIFETLKKLSEDKLVIIVSHDREFAEMYGDRIIEFKDGEIVSDMIKKDAGFAEQIRVVDGATVTDEVIKIPAGTPLTQQHVNLMQKFIAGGGDLIISSDKNLNKYFADSFNPNKKRKGVFANTSEADLNLSAPTTPFKLIKSRLSSSNARRMARSSMSHKKGRLVFSILLTVFAVVFFGFSNVVGNFNTSNVVASVMRNNGYNHIVVSKNIKPKKNSLFSWGSSAPFSREERSQLAQMADGSARFIDASTSLPTNPANAVPDPSLNSSYFSKTIRGFVATDDFSALGLNVPPQYGRFPTADDEVLITNYHAEHFMALGLSYYDGTSTPKNFTPTKINDVLSYTVSISGILAKIVGIINFDIDRYKDYKSAQTASSVSRAIVSEFNDRVGHEIGFVYCLNSFADKNLNIKSLYNVYSYNVATNLPDISSRNSLSYVVSPYSSLYLNYSAAVYSPTSTTLPTPKDDEVILNLYEYQRQLRQNNGNYDSFPLLTKDELITMSSQLGLFDSDFRLTMDIYNSDMSYQDIHLSVAELNLKVVGVFSDYSNGLFHLSDGQIDNLVDTTVTDSYFVYLKDSASIESFTTSFVGEQKSSDERLVNDFAFSLPLSSVVVLLSSMFSMMSIVFFWMSIAFCVFAALLLLNFISTSVVYKRKEIGILRAIGARQQDVLGIFIWEGLFIALWILGFAVSIIFGLTVAINNIISSQLNASFTTLNFGVLELLYMTLLCFGTVVIASILPVSRVSRMKPIDAIRGK